MTHLACETASSLRVERPCGDPCQLRSVRWDAWFCYLTHSQQETTVPSLSISHVPASPLLFLAPGKAEFCPKRRLQTLLLCTDKLTTALSNNHILSHGTFILWDQKVCFILSCAMWYFYSEQFPVLGSQLICLKSCIPALLSSPTRESFRDHRGQAHLGQPMVTVKATSANKTTHFNNSPLV